MKPIVSTTIRTQAEFYDLDPMNVVWHGNHARFFELGRRALLDKIDYGYEAMRASGFAWPVVEMTIRYAQPIKLKQAFDVGTSLVEWQNRLKLDFEIRDAASGKRIARAHTIQVAVDLETETMLWETPPILREKLAAYLPSSS